MAIPSIWFDLWPAYLLLGLLVVGVVFNWAWDALGIGPFLEKWLVTDDPAESSAQLINFPKQPPSHQRMCVIPPDDEGYEPMSLKVISGGHTYPLGTTNQLAEEIQVREDLEQTPLPEFVTEWSRQKNDAIIKTSLNRIYDDNSA